MEQRQGRHRTRPSARPPLTRLRSLLLALMVVLAAALLASAGPNGRRRGYATPVAGPLQAAAHPRQPMAWGETWEFEEDVLEPLRGLGTRILDFVLRRQPPEEPHPLRMQRWTIYMRKFPFRRCGWIRCVCVLVVMVGFKVVVALDVIEEQDDQRFIHPGGKKTG